MIFWRQNREKIGSKSNCIPLGSAAKKEAAHLNPSSYAGYIPSWKIHCLKFLHRATFVWPWKMVSVSVRYLFYQPMDEKIKTWLFVFSPKKTLTWRRHGSIGQSCCRMTSKRSIDWFLEVLGHEVFSPERSLNQPKATSVCIRSINQSNRYISVRLIFLFCSQAFISRSYENRPNCVADWTIQLFLFYFRFFFLTTKRRVPVLIFSSILS